MDPIVGLRPRQSCHARCPVHGSHTSKGVKLNRPVGNAGLEGKRLDGGRRKRGPLISVAGNRIAWLGRWHYSTPLGMAK